MSDPSKTPSRKPHVAEAAAPDDSTTATVTETQPEQAGEPAAPAEPAPQAPVSEASSVQPPTPATGAGGAGPESHQHAAAPPASPAAVVTAQPIVQQASAEVIDLEGVRAEERRATLAYVTEVHELCAIAGRGDLAGGFIARAAPVAQVRKALLEARAAEDEATVIRSQVRPATGEPAQPTIDTAAIYAARNQNAR